MITLTQARAIVAAGEDRASRLGIPVNIAVLDAGAHLKAFSRMDGALLGSIEIATGKARTAALFGIPSEVIWDYAKPGSTSPGLENTNGGLVAFAGGRTVHGFNGLVDGGLDARQTKIDALAKLEANEFENGAPNSKVGTPAKKSTTAAKKGSK